MKTESFEDNNLSHENSYGSTEGLDGIEDILKDPQEVKFVKEIFLPF